MISIFNPWLYISFIHNLQLMFMILTNFVKIQASDAHKKCGFKLFLIILIATDVRYLELNFKVFGLCKFIDKIREKKTKKSKIPHAYNI